MELKREQDLIKREILKREKEYKAKLAQVEANAWAEAASNRSSVRIVSAISITSAAECKLDLTRSSAKVKELQKDCVRE